MRLRTRPNHALQRTRRERRGCNPRVPWIGPRKWPLHSFSPQFASRAWSVQGSTMATSQKIGVLIDDFAIIVPFLKASSMSSAVMLSVALFVADS
jgi:hypothetical protein